VGEAVVVIGVGNRDRGDDGVGPEVLARVEGRLPRGARPARLAGDDPAAIMEAWQGAGRAIVVDAMSSGAAPGTVRRVDVGEGPLPADLGLVSTHALGAAAAIELARVLGRLPASLVVYGVEGEDFTRGASLSRAVAAAVPAVANQVLAEVGDA
jgi:hydrogenase maturation protease